MTDELDKLADAELSEVFAVEVAGVEHIGNLWRNTGECWMIGVPPFATDANAVLPWLEKLPDWKVERMAFGGIDVEIYTENSYKVIAEAKEYAFPRAVCIALIRAKRAEKQEATP